MSGQPDLFFDEKTDFLNKENVLYLIYLAKPNAGSQRATGGRSPWEKRGDVMYRCEISVML